MLKNVMDFEKGSRDENVFKFLKKKSFLTWKHD